MKTGLSRFYTVFASLETGLNQFMVQTGFGLVLQYKSNYLHYIFTYNKLTYTKNLLTINLLTVHIKFFIILYNININKSSRRNVVDGQTLRFTFRVREGFGWVDDRRVETQDGGVVVGE